LPTLGRPEKELGRRPDKNVSYNLQIVLVGLRFGGKTMLPALGSMKVTEQIDVMEASAVDPYKFLTATRVLACIGMLPLLIKGYSEEFASTVQKIS
jgi:hypothetical protein